MAVGVVTTIEAKPCDHERGASRVKKHAAFVSLPFYAHLVVVRHENDSKSDALSSQVYAARAQYYLSNPARCEKSLVTLALYRTVFCMRTIFGFWEFPTINHAFNACEENEKQKTSGLSDARNRTIIEFH